MSDDITVTKSSGNVFADLGFDKSEEERLKAQLVRGIRDILNGRRLLGLKQPDVSALINGQTAKFSIDRLLRCIRGLDHEVTLVIKPAKRAKRGTGAAQAAA